jgi:hypothetical protein
VIPTENEPAGGLSLARRVVLVAALIYGVGLYAGAFNVGPSTVGYADATHGAVTTAQNRPQPESKTQSQSQPQGETGPLTTTTGGAPASSPQGETPPGMQSAPQGSSEKTVAPAK